MNKAIFDIAEIFARKLHKALREYVFNKKNFQTDLKHIYDGIVAAKTAMQDEYDRETNHSINKDKQNEWLIKIADLLQTFEPWAAY
jgi:histone acetyltransferase (RNA polymerase elongator complex component)